MPPHLKPISPSGVDYSAVPLQPGHLLKALLLLALLVTAARSVFLLRARSKRRMADMRPSPDQKLGHARPVPKKKDSGNEDDKMTASPHLYPQLHANHYLQSLRQETQQPSLVPVYPWIAPPTPLPGPYDAPIFPLPWPTIRSQFEQSPQPDTVTSMTTSRRESTNSISSTDSETLSTRSYTRRLSNNVQLPYDPVLEGSSTVSSAGWRRTQWTVSAG